MSLRCALIGRMLGLRREGHGTRRLTPRPSNTFRRTEVVCGLGCWPTGGWSLKHRENPEGADKGGAVKKGVGRMPNDDESGPRDKDEGARLLPKGRDRILTDIVELVTIGVEVGMTLSVGGLLASGVVISAKTYLVESAAKVRSSVPSNVGEMIAGYFERQVAAHEKPANVPANYRAPPPKYTHMRSPTFIAPNGATSTVTDSLWRWKLSEVDGFSLSQISPKK